jgi:protein tyrosine/serine phosphatase
MKQEGGYRDQWLVHQLVGSVERSDYAHLSDEAFANFRVIDTTGMGAGKLYRSSSPINPDIGRSTYADKAARDAGIRTVINLADPSNVYETPEDSYYRSCQVTYLNPGMDPLAEDFKAGLAQGMRSIISGEAPYLIHCNEGKDRAGFVSAVLECLMGATADEVVDDYMETFFNYYGVEKGTEKYNAVVNSNIIPTLKTIFGVADIYTADLEAEAEAYFMEDLGLSAKEVAELKVKLGS